MIDWREDIQKRSLEADRSVGRKHFPVLIGRRAICFIYGTFLLLTYVSLVIGVTLECLPRTSLLGLSTFPMAACSFLGALRHADEVRRLMLFMTLKVVIILTTPILIAIGLFAA